MDTVPTLDVLLRNGREETLLELPVPVVFDAIAELVRDVYLVETDNGVMTCIDGSLYHTPYTKRVPGGYKVHIILVERLGMAVGWSDIVRYVEADTRCKFASGVWLSTNQCAIAYSIVPGDVSLWEYSPHQYTLEIIGDGPYKNGPVADIVAYVARDPDLPPLEYFDADNACQVCFRISSSGESIYLFNDSRVFQIRLNLPEHRG